MPKWCLPILRTTSRSTGMFPARAKFWIARGVDERPVRADRIRKSVGAENTFSADILVRKFAIKLFDRDEGEAANWKLIAETLFKAAFDAPDRSPDDASRVALLRRVHTGSYDRLAADPAASKTHALTGQNEAAPADLQSSGPGAADAFRHTI
jgi:hypothetical protein